MSRYDLSCEITINGEVKYSAEITSFVAAKVIALLAQIENEGTEEVKVATPANPTQEEVRKHIQECESQHMQQVAYSTFHDALTQICYDCKVIRTSIYGGLNDYS